MRAPIRVTMLAALAGAGFAASPASAQQLWGWGYYNGFGPKPPIVDRPARYYLERPIPRDEVAEILREEGYRPLTRPVLSGDAYIAQVENRRGQRLEVVVHAYDGDIIERRLLGGRPAPTVRRPMERDQAVLPPVRPDLTPQEDAIAPSPVAPPPAVQRAPLAPPAQEQAAVPPRDNQTVTPPRQPAPPPAARPREPDRAALPPKPAGPGAAPTLETTEPPKEQQARQAPRVILPNPADPSSNAVQPATPLETQPSRPTPAQ
ncbi:MAG: hypothetical protein BGP06_13250 [Rhizobiales bacterium 65-9]|nr:hypothetical protein [Hyphomicrobiales bacterium]OJY34085.1 MAG: hypothetical protein BGP06_13250 [Rhizobiales bacterium 65-9]